MNIRLEILGPNQTQVFIREKVLFFSYDTLVAVQDRGQWYRTNENYSRTTSKHLNAHVPANALSISPETLQKIASE